jgi:hypothetical protein
MGDMLQAACSCGFVSEVISAGGGKMNFMETCNVPYYCDNCKSVGETNILMKSTDDLPRSVLRKSIKCEKCRRKVQHYGEIKKEDTEDEDSYVFEWNIDDDKTYFLKDKPHYCPKCKKENLKFYATGCWD